MNASRAENGGAERAVLLERATASIAHAVANAANVVVGRAHMLQMGARADAVDHSTKEILARIEALTRTLEQVRRFAESARSTERTRSLSEELRAAWPALSATAAESGVTLRLASGTDGGEIEVPADALRIMLRGVLGFAIARSPRGSTVSVRLDAREVPRHHAPVRVAALAVELPVEAKVPETPRGVLEPWLEGALPDAEERLLLAVGVGAAYDRAGWYELEPAVSGVRLSVFLRALGDR